MWINNGFGLFFKSSNNKEITFHVCHFYLTQSSVSPQPAATLSFHYNVAVAMLYLRLRWHFHWQPYILSHLQLSQNNTFQAETSIFALCQEVGVCIGGKHAFLKNSNSNFFER